MRDEKDAHGQLCGQVVTLSLDFILIAVIIFNILYCIGTLSYRYPFPDQKRPSRFPNELLKLPPTYINFTVNESELSQAIEFLRLPTWTRSYRHCSHPESEVTCPQVIKAYRVIKRWQDTVTSMDNESRKYLIIQHPAKGLGNKMMSDIVGFAVALMSNRTVLVKSNHPDVRRNRIWEGNIYKFPDCVLTNETQLPETVRSMSWQGVLPAMGSDWSCYDLESLINSDAKIIGMREMIVAPMLYVNKQTADFCWEHFGAHAGYFLGNYFSRFDDESFQRALDFLDKIPKPKRLIGVHVRYHRPGGYFSKDFNTTMPTIFEELDRRRAKRDTEIVVATDNMTVKRMVVTRYGDRIHMLRMFRKPDRDHKAAQTDMALLMACDEVIATLRSTFSWIVVSRTGKRAWWVEKESRHVFPASNSQACGISILYHYRDNCDWRTNDRVEYCGSEQRETLEKFFDYFLL